MPQRPAATMRRRTASTSQGAPGQEHVPSNAPPPNRHHPPCHPPLTTTPSPTRPRPRRRQGRGEGGCGGDGTGGGTATIGWGGRRGAQRTFGWMTRPAREAGRRGVVWGRGGASATTSQPPPAAAAVSPRACHDVPSKARRPDGPSFPPLVGAARASFRASVVRCAATRRRARWQPLPVGSLTVGRRESSLANKKGVLQPQSTDSTQSSVVKRQTEKGPQ